MPCPPLWVVRIVKLHRKKQAKLRHDPPLWKLCISFDHTKDILCVFSRLVPRFGRKLGPKLSENLFCSSPNFGQEIGPKLSEDLFYFCSSPNFGRKIGLILSGTIFVSDLSSSKNFLKFLPPPPFQNPAYATVYRHPNKRTNILPLTTSHIDHLCNQLNHVCTANFYAAF